MRIIKERKRASNLGGPRSKLRGSSGENGEKKNKTVCGISIRLLSPIGHCSKIKKRTEHLPIHSGSVGHHPLQGCCLKMISIIFMKA